MDNNKPQFGKIIERERLSRDLSLVGLSNLLGVDGNGKAYVSPSYINRIEKMERYNLKFSDICIFSKVLSLDLFEVFESFGFEELLSKVKLDKNAKIEEILRAKKIEAPLVKDSKNQTISELLDFREKEIILSIINNIFEISIKGDESYMDLTFNITKKIDEYKNIREGKANNYALDKNHKKKLEVKIANNQKELWAELNLNDKYIDKLTGYSDEDRFEIMDGKFKTKDVSKGLIFEIKKSENIMKIINIELI